jgi:benzoyl-CoA reductase/2-hydroxyglutaryl-CoA dehydratase subunit BcrC/BadD/HgdB
MVSSGTSRAAGWFCALTPVELLAAAGLAPRRLLGGVAPAAAAAYLTPNLCPYVRSAFAAALADEPGGLARPAAVVFTNSCNAMIHLHGAWAGHLKPAFTHLLSVPRHTGDAATEFFAAALGGLLDALESFAGRRVPDDDLQAAMAACDELRARLRAAYAGQAASPPPLSARGLLEAARAAALLPPAAALAALRETGCAPPPAAPQSPATPQDIVCPGPRPVQARPRRPRLLLTGSVLDPALVAAIQAAAGAAGADVVIDDLCLGSRYAFLGEEGGTGGATGTGRDGLLRRIARAYLERPPCPRMARGERREAHVLGLVRRFRCDGVLAFALKFCDTTLYDQPRLKTALAAQGVPALLCASEYGAEAAGQVATRVGAFVEML